MAAKITKKKIEQLARALFPRYGIKDVDGLVATIVKYRNNDGHVKIWKPEGGWGWFATPGTTVATPSLVALKFGADYRRTAAQARDDLYHQLERATESVLSEDEIDAAIARAGTGHATKKRPASARAGTGHATKKRLASTRAGSSTSRATKKRSASARAGSSSHATKKTSPAQLDREIAESLQKNVETTPCDECGRPTAKGPTNWHQCWDCIRRHVEGRR